MLNNSQPIPPLHLQIIPFGPKPNPTTTGSPTPSLEQEDDALPTPEPPCPCPPPASLTIVAVPYAVLENCPPLLLLLARHHAEVIVPGVGVPEDEGEIRGALQDGGLP